jgi:hypothetical protein
VNIAGPLATLIFAITVLTVFGGLFAYGVYKARERTRKKPASTKKELAYFVEYTLPVAVGAVGYVAESKSAAKASRPWALYLLSLVALTGLAVVGVYYFRSGRRLVLQGAWAVGTTATKEFPGPPALRRPNRGPPVNLAKLARRPASLFPKPAFDANGNGVIDRDERSKFVKVPQTILLTVDDNGHAQGLKWLQETFERFGIWGNVTFFITGNYAKGRPSFLGGPIDAWWNMLSNENFVGLHGQTHEAKTEAWARERWLSEHNATMAELQSQVRAPEGWTWEAYPWGSRAPFLFFTDAYFDALESVAPRVAYDASMVAHSKTPKLDGEGRDVSWPFSLETPVPADVELPFSEAKKARVEIRKHPIIEVPLNAWAMRGTDNALKWIPSLDVNLFQEHVCSGDTVNVETVEAFEKNLESHYKGNRAPFHLGLHAQNYTADRECERATIEAILTRVQQYTANKWNFEYKSIPRLLEWMAED